MCLIKFVDTLYLFLKPLKNKIILHEDTFVTSLVTNFIVIITVTMVTMVTNDAEVPTVTTPTLVLVAKDILRLV